MSWPFVRAMIDREELTSTSDLAREILAAGATELPFAVRARRQTRGRGRGQNAWWSDEGSLTFTVALDPAQHGLRLEHEPRVALASAVALVESIVVYLPADKSPMIRWPNDIEVVGKKLAGILPEKVETPSGSRLLIGIGLNVETRLSEAPAEVRRMATTLRELTPLDLPDLETMIKTLLKQLEFAVDRLAADDPALAGQWSRLDALRGQTVHVDLGHKIVSGSGAGIDREGALTLEMGVESIRLFGGRVLRGR